MYKIKITYDTGDSFHQEHGLTEHLKMKWSNLDKAKQALRDIEAHYKHYLIMHKEWNADQKDKDKSKKKAEKMPWYDREYPDFTIHLENDSGNREQEHCFWCGYFESLVGVDVESDPEEGLSLRF